ncbi:MAG: hypothetical protein Q7T55_22390, partial [Solirubrobacteraceae bacterium]|nr:hypothetical protein [Solirubrobacteraceae bacterium]
MTQFEYDEDASAAWRMDVVHEVPSAVDPSTAASRWVEGMRRLNSIDDRLARKIVALHRKCGSGTGACDSVDDDAVPVSGPLGWGCETMET